MGGDLPAPADARWVFRLKELIERDMDRLARLVTEEHGKVLDDAKGSVTRGPRGGRVRPRSCRSLMKGDYSYQVGGGGPVLRPAPGRRLRRDHAVQLPGHDPLWMAPLAIACGNAFILKPSERDPSCPMALAELMMEAGVPEGDQRRQRRQGRRRRDPGPTRIAAVSFVGSTPIAEYVYKTGTAHAKRPGAGRAKTTWWPRPTPTST